MFLPFMFSFNTSHVSINRKTEIRIGCVDGFNTSHVSINPFRQGQRTHLCVVSIHLMFLLINRLTALNEAYISFNTSHVSINPTGA